MNTRDYLSHAASSRALYRTLIEDAISLLSPVPMGQEEVVSYLSIAKLAKRMEISQSTIQGDLRRLENMGWISGQRPRKLGHRDCGVFYLIADVAALQVTGENNLVTLRVLHGLIELVAKKEGPTTGRGGARRWVDRDKLEKST